MELVEELDRIASVAEGYAGEGERLAGVLPAEPDPGARVYVCAFERGDDRSWLALDRDGAPLLSRARVRDAVSIAALCELADENAGGGDLSDLRSRLVSLRLTEHVDGIGEAEEAALALESVVGSPPRVATPAHLDAVGAATLRLERALGETATSPFAAAMQQARVAVDELALEVEIGLQAAARVTPMEGGFGFPFGGDPEELMRGLREFAEKQAETVHEAQREQFATLTLNTAVELTGAALSQMNPQGTAEEQAMALRDAMRVLFPEAVALVSAARQGFMREG